MTLMAAPARSEGDGDGARRRLTREAWDALVERLMTAQHNLDRVTIGRDVSRSDAEDREARYLAERDALRQELADAYFASVA